MKTAILLALAALCAFSATAQTEAVDENRHYVGLHTGAVFPLDDFKKSSFEDPYPAYAKEGVLLLASYRYSLHKLLAVGGSLGTRYNKYKMEELVQVDGDLLLDEKSEAWRSVFAMADAYFTLLSEDWVKAYVKGSAGASFNRSASWELNTKYGDIIMPADKATALALGWGAGFDFYPEPRFGVNLEVGTLYTKPEFTVPDIKGRLFQHQQPMHTVFVNVGLFHAF
ncbi:outer membrane beta-barrel protein [Pontibacter akesuensis]|uniref:Outer membrane protein beta-barrel domain-containing protein n=1 Tax=Pontibacter akesuensis TaxID=388950 RepID=A0A1I7KLC6_9BACT|nr:outer membrane beta-barrel protein [Pontibacter akesuensis]GHA77954.1 hypothetical protein GCM10007389_34750 [Pontibacter akesuensis]SFU98237.1 Outer membrane protein beta-barrel domain-containing protein [Pontibacter akesuensis]